jgi:hypothetical protein
MLQAGRSRVRVPMRWIFFSLLNPSSRTIALGSTQPLTEMLTRNLPGRGGGKGRPSRKADNLTAICEPIVCRKCESIDVSQPYEPSQPVTRIALHFLPLPLHSGKVAVMWSLSSPANAGVKIAWCFTSTVPYNFMAWRLMKDVENSFSTFVEVLRT